MSVLYIAIPIALVVALAAIVTFVVLVRSGQYDDLDTPPYRMLFDDEANRNGQPGGRNIPAGGVSHRNHGKMSQSPEGETLVIKKEN